MPNSLLARHGAALGLFLAGSTALIGAQQVLNTAANAETAVAIVETHDFQRLSEPKLTLASTDTVQAAVSTGQFEELAKPTLVPAVAPTPEQKPAPAPTPQPTPALAPKVVFESGVASTYGEDDGFEGNLTACGQVFHTNIVQVAHKSLPCGTIVQVEDTDTGRSVEAEVTDRGPYVPGRVVDLSWAAFKQLDPTGPGLLRVNVYVLDRY